MRLGGDSLERAPSVRPSSVWLTAILALCVGPLAGELAAGAANPPIDRFALVTRHICIEGHGVTREEVEEVLAENYETTTRSRSSGLPEAFGWTASGKYLTVVFERVSDDPLTVYPITAYEVPPPGSRKRRKRR